MNNQERKEHVLYEFAVEPEHDSETLAKYVAAYPDLKSDLIELAWELNASQFDVDEAPAEIPDPKFEDALEELLSSEHAPRRTSNPFQGVSRQQFAGMCSGLGVSRGFMIAIRDKRVRLNSIPERFLAAAAKIMETTLEDLRSYLDDTPRVLGTAEFKADKKPMAIEQITFEQLIKDTELSDEQRKTALEYLEDDRPD